MKSNLPRPLLAIAYEEYAQAYLRSLPPTGPASRPAHDPA